MLLHWIIAVLIFGQVALCWYMLPIADEPGSERYFDLHKSTGLVAGGLIMLRIAWRLTHKPAALPDSVPRWEAIASHTVQWLLYACMVLMPITGYFGAAFSEEGVPFFGFRLPALVSRNHDMSTQLFGIHSTVSWVLLVLIAAHVLGGLKHLLIDKDRVFQRMWS
jgi:cytochrome b561